MSTGALRIERFRPDDQAAVRGLILAGLAERWGRVDAALNPDLDDIAARYSDAVVLVAWIADEIVGTGVLVRRSDAEREIVRMSVARPHRRKGIGRRILADLVASAERSGARRILLETTATWHDAIALYTPFGFRHSHDAEGRFGPDSYFILDLPHRS